MSRRPQRSAADSTAASGTPGLVRSPACAAASPARSAATDWARSASMSLTRTFAPAALSLRATCSPMPCPAPVTTATRPSNSAMTRLLSLIETHIVQQGATLCTDRMSDHQAGDLAAEESEREVEGARGESLGLVVVERELDLGG